MQHVASILAFTVDWTDLITVFDNITTKKNNPSFQAAAAFRTSSIYHPSQLIPLHSRYFRNHLFDFNLEGLQGAKMNNDEPMRRVVCLSPMGWCVCGCVYCCEFRDRDFRTSSTTFMCRVTVFVWFKIQLSIGKWTTFHKLGSSSSGFYNTKAKNDDAESDE